MQMRNELSIAFLGAIQYFIKFLDMNFVFWKIFPSPRLILSPVLRG